MRTCIVCGEILKSHQKMFCTTKCMGIKRKEERYNRFDLSGDLGTECGVVSKTAKQYLIDKRGHKCEMCGFEEWLGDNIPLELHHIDGLSLNNMESNLQLLCPNCHAKTDNYKSKNKECDRTYRNKYYNYQ